MVRGEILAFEQKKWIGVWLVWFVCVCVCVRERESDSHKSYPPAVVKTDFFVATVTKGQIFTRVSSFTRPRTYDKANLHEAQKSRANGATKKMSEFLQVQEMTVKEKKKEDLG